MHTNPASMPDRSHPVGQPSRFGRALALCVLLVVAGQGLVHAEGPGQPKVDTRTGHPAGKPAALVAVSDAWVRATVKGQTASGGYMSLTASQDLTLVGFTSPAAGETELHEMVMDGSVMRMRALDALPLPAGQAVALKPGAGGKHLMLMDLRRQLVAGKEIELVLQLRTAGGKAVSQRIKVPVKAPQRPGASGASSPSSHADHGTHGGHPHAGH